ncbi:germination protein YpeB [Peribacillus sp. SCS-37]|uniref:germination protein YpeB n=1 Tax=Paraperibacillus esterisolvens TaxID=3115296 RepID=UPI00390675B4
MIRNIVIAVLVLAAAGTGFWGYQEHQEKNAILVNAENNYQRAFHDLTYQVDLLHDKIGTTLAMNSKESLSPALADVWRISSEANMDVGQLPLTLMPFNKTEEFLSSLGSFSYKAAVRDLEKQPLSDKEYKNLQGLYKQSNVIQNELRKVQYLVLKHNLRWMDVELAMASGKENADNTIIDGFKTVEKKSTGYSEKSNFDPSFVSMNKRDRNFRNIEGKKISKNEAAAIAKRYAGINGRVHAKVEDNGRGADFGFYSVSIKKAGNDGEVNMDITKKGGYPVWLINTRDIKKARIGLNEASGKAARFLKDNDFASLELYESAQYDNIGLFNFVTSVNGTRIYPESIRIKIALDSGQVIGFSADEYLKGHKKRKLERPGMTVEEARKKINPKVKIMEERVAVITNDLNEEVLCHEFLGVIGEDTYRIFINAKTGEEEKVDKLQNAEPNYERLV